MTIANRTMIVMTLVSLFTLTLFGCDCFVNEEPSINAIYLSITKNIPFGDTTCPENEPVEYVGEEEAIAEMEDYQEPDDPIVCDPCGPAFDTEMIKVKPDTDLIIAVDETVTIIADTSDPDGDTITYTFKVMAGNEVIANLESFGNVAIWTVEYTGNYIIKITAEDEDDHIVEDSFPIIVYNERPPVQQDGQQPAQPVQPAAPENPEGCKDYMFWVTTQKAIPVKVEKQTQYYAVTAFGRLKKGRSDNPLPGAAIVIRNLTAEAKAAAGETVPQGRGTTSTENRNSWSPRGIFGTTKIGYIFIGDPEVAIEKNGGANCVAMDLRHSRQPDMVGKGDHVRITVTIPDTDPPLVCTWDYEVSKSPGSTWKRL